MRDFWTFIGGVAVGILAVTGVFATEGENKSCSIEIGEDEIEGGEEGSDGEMDDERRLIVRST